jgi:hypothetical protein
VLRLNGPLLLLPLLLLSLLLLLLLLQVDATSIVGSVEQLLSGLSADVQFTILMLLLLQVDHASIALQLLLGLFLYLGTCCVSHWL